VRLPEGEELGSNILRVSQRSPANSSLGRSAPLLANRRPPRMAPASFKRIHAACIHTDRRVASTTAMAAAVAKQIAKKSASRTQASARPQRAILAIDARSLTLVSIDTTRSGVGRWGFGSHIWMSRGRYLLVPGPSAASNSVIREARRGQGQKSSLSAMASIARSDYGSRLIPD
jgi:hypothetical protein